MLLMLALLVLCMGIGTADELKNTADSTNVTLTCITGTKGVSDNEGPDRLFDNNLYTHWCTRETDHPYVIF